MGIRRFIVAYDDDDGEPPRSDVELEFEILRALTGITVEAVGPLEAVDEPYARAPDHLRAPASPPPGQPRMRPGWTGRHTG